MAKTVKLETGLNTLAEPVFIVKDKNDKLYLAIALLEYDKLKTGGNPEKEKGVKLIQDMFTAAGKLEACEFKSRGTLPAGATGDFADVAKRERAAPSLAAGGSFRQTQAGRPGMPERPGREPPVQPPQPGPPPPPGPPAPPEDPPGVQTEPPGVQTSP